MSAKTIGQKTVESLMSVLRKIQNGEQMVATKIVRHETPDGSMHTIEEIVVCFETRVDNAEGVE